VRSLVEGDRPYVLALLGVLALAAAMISGPLQQYRDGHRRLELLQRKQTLVSAEVARLEQRKADLQDPEQIERLVREQLGYVRPGEIPYVVVTRPPAPPEAFEPAEVDRSLDVPGNPERWYQRVWDLLTRRTG
jgi:cell division protein FtsB